MLPLSANADFKNIDEYTIQNPYYDIGFELSKKVEVYGWEAIDQAIEMVLCTEPLERLFNPTFWSPLYQILFENATDIDDKVNYVFDAIESWVPIKIDRNSAEIENNTEKNQISFIVPYFYTAAGDIKYHEFRRIIGK